MYDYCVVGGGIVGFATAWQLLKLDPQAKLLLLEKEPVPGKHQTGHNSGVIHAGIYYAPGSLKASLCREGLDATKDFCRQNDVPFQECGKLIVATNAEEITRIETLYQRGIANDLTLEWLDADDLHHREPNVVGKAALYSPETAIVDYSIVCERIAASVRKMGGEVRYDSAVDRIEECAGHVNVGTEKGQYQAKKIIVCGGLQADRLARISGLEVDFRIIPFRGEYFKLPSDKNQIVNHLIYPAPDPSMPFLGIHLTRMIDGGVTVGPNAVLGFSREGYPKHSFSASDVLDFCGFPGFWKLIFKNRKHAFHELMTSISKSAYLKECQKYCPSLRASDLKPYRAGIRAQVVSTSGEAIHDFVFKQTNRMLHVCNAPSPAATSAIPIGKMIAERCVNPISTA